MIWKKFIKKKIQKSDVGFSEFKTTPTDHQSSRAFMNFLYWTNQG